MREREKYREREKERERGERELLLNSRCVAYTRCLLHILFNLSSNKGQQSKTFSIINNRT